MSRVFVDTSALLALLVPSDAAHSKARRAFAALQAQAASLATSSYVLVETYALLATRCGLDAVRQFRTEFAPLLDVLWVGGELHDQGLDLQLAGGRKSVSLVDCVSIVAVRAGAFDGVFAFDPHLGQAGAPLLP